MKPNRWRCATETAASPQSALPSSTAAAISVSVRIAGSMAGPSYSICERTQASIILDQATEGLAPPLREEIWRVMVKLRQTGLAILAIDKYIQRLIALADRHTILERGSSSAHSTDRSVWERFIGV